MKNLTKPLLLSIGIFSSIVSFSQTVHNYDNQGILFSTINTTDKFVGIGDFSWQTPSQQLEIHGYSNNTLLGKNTKSAIRINNNDWSSFGLRSEIQFGIDDNNILAAISTSYTGYDSNTGGSLTFATSDRNSSEVSPRMIISEFGNVGINHTSPTAKLHIKGNSNAWPLKIEHVASNPWEVSAEINFNGPDNTTPFQITRGSGELIFAIRGTGLINARSIKAEEVEITAIAMNIVPDYVFGEHYQLMPLDEVEHFYKTNKHLPEVPSAKEIAQEGLNLKEMNLLLLKKVEELTIHLVELQKQVEELKAKPNQDEK